MDATEPAPNAFNTISRPLPQEDQARADMYALVASLLLNAPDAGLLKAMAEAGPLDAAQPENAFAQAWNALIDTARLSDPQQVRSEFDTLFISTGTPLLNPYGSYYLAGFMMEKPLAALRDDLAVLGLRRRQGAGELEDHLGALCETMRILICGGHGLPRRTTPEQRTFFTRHIAPWYGRCLDDIRAAKDVCFYRDVADFAAAFLQLEGEAFSMDEQQGGAADAPPPPARFGNAVAGKQQHAMEGQTI
jgi:TorA maturation chaperone TorD